MEELLNVLHELYPDIDFTAEKHLISDGLIDSADTVSLISELEEVFDITITMKYLKPEYFESAETLWSMIRQLQ